MRSRICQELGFHGLRMDEELNGAANGQVAMWISEDSGFVQIWVIPTDEERQIAWSTYEQVRN